MDSVYYEEGKIDFPYDLGGYFFPTSVDYATSFHHG